MGRRIQHIRLTELLQGDRAARPGEVDPKTGGDQQGDGVNSSARCRLRCWSSSYWLMPGRRGIKSPGQGFPRA
jgi:hypothetical protein